MDQSINEILKEFRNAQNRMRSQFSGFPPLFSMDFGVPAAPGLQDPNRKMFHRGMFNTAGISQILMAEMTKQPIGHAKIREMAMQEVDLQQVTVEQIHEDFYSAGESLVAEANLILQRAADKELQKKAARLKSLGFEKATEVRQMDEAIEKRADAQATLRRLQELQMRYPLSRFISRADLNQLCEKYKLILGPIKAYTGSIPEANLIELEKATRVQEQDFQSSEWSPVFDDGEVNSSLCIVAPAKDMDMPSYFSRPAGIPEDPIVVEPVKGGFFRIITAWGPEAQDPAVLPFREN